MDLGLTGRRAIVTGGSRGIGAATAALLGAEGAHVAVIGRDTEALAAVAAATGAHAVAADLASATGVEQGIGEAIAALGGVDILVNNAGASTTGSFDEITDDQWYAAFDLKVMGYVRCMRAVLPSMRGQQFGRIVNVGGTAGIRATPGYTLAALNAAIVHLTRSTAELVGKDGITVTSLHPGPTLTDRLRTMLGRAAEQSGSDVEAFANDVIGKSLPLGRVGSAQEVAAMIVVLCSDLAGWVTGGGITVDGGAAQGLVGG